MDDSDLSHDQKEVGRRSAMKDPPEPTIPVTHSGPGSNPSDQCRVCQKAVGIPPRWGRQTGFSFHGDLGDTSVRQRELVAGPASETF